MSGGEVAGDLERFTRGIFPRRRTGATCRNPRCTDERGVDSLPPKPADPFLYIAGAVGLGIVLALSLLPKRRTVKAAVERGRFRPASAGRTRRIVTGAPSAT